MSLETRNRLLTIVFLLLVTLLVGELSYFFFNHRNTFTPTPTPSIISQAPTANPSPSSTIHITKNSSFPIENLKTIFTKIRSKQQYIEEVNVSIVTKQILIEKNKNFLKVSPIDNKSRISIIHLTPYIHKILQIILSDKPQQSLNDISVLTPNKIITIKSVYSIKKNQKPTITLFQIYQ